MSDSDDAIMAQSRTSASKMRSLFASDQRVTQAGSQSLKYEGPREDVLKPTRAGPGAPPVPAGGQMTTACSAPVYAYKGSNPVGQCIIACASSAATGVCLIIVDAERRPQAKVKVDDGLQLLQNPADRSYASLFDSAFQGHWSLAFQTPEACLAFVVGVLTVQHFTLLPDGPRPPSIELAVAEEPPTVRKGDTVVVGMSVWLQAVKGSMYTAGKLVEDIPEAAPRRFVVGEGMLMQGVEEALIGMGPGGRKVLFVPAKKTRTKGLGNPEINTGDAVVVALVVTSVESFDGSLGLKDASLKKSVSGSADRQLALTGGPAAAPAAAAAVAAPVAAPAAAAAPGTDSLLLQALLMQTLQQRTAPAPAAVEASSGISRESSAFIERSLAMIQQQLSGLYDKVDRMELEKKLDDNNAKLERIVKKAVGKLPTLDVDIEDATKDREALLAKIEQQRLKLEESKNDYYAALEVMGKHKDEVLALKNDVAIATRTGEDRIRELTERHRLESVDAEVRFRRELDATSERRYEEGRTQGFASGFQQGRADGIASSGSASTEELRQQLVAREQSNLDLQSRLAELEARSYEERRQALEQQQMLQGVIDRLEQRNNDRARGVVESGALNAKFIRKVLNSAYASIESQFYATEKDAIPLQDALNMVLVAVKSESKSASEELKKIATIESKEPVVSSVIAAASEVPSFSALTTSSGAAPSGMPPAMPPPPPPPPMPMSMERAATFDSNTGAGSYSTIDAATAAIDAVVASMPPRAIYDEDLVSPADAAASAALRDGSGDATVDSNAGGAPAMDEDFVQKMLAEYRAQRDAELAAGGGGATPIEEEAE